MLRGLTREARFLLTCTSDSDVTSHRLQNLTTPELDWDLLFQTVKKHELIPLVYNIVLAKSLMVPSGFLENLRSHALRITERNMALSRELLTVLPLLENKGIQAIAYKGPLLAERLYGNIALRCVDDLELLIQKENILKAKDLLLKQGYRTQKVRAGGYEFISKNSSHRLEIYSKIAPKTFSLALDHEGIWKRSVTMAFEGKLVHAFSNEDLFLILCAGGKKHVWKSLSRILDIAQALRVHPDLDWEQILSHAKMAGAERILFVGISLASILFEGRLPPKIKLQTEQDTAVKSLVKRMIGQIFSNTEGKATVARMEKAAASSRNPVK